MTVLLDRVESSGDGGNVVKRWLNDMTEEPSVTCLPVVLRLPLSRAHSERMVCMWSEMNAAEPIESAAVSGARKHAGNVASVGGFGASAPCLQSSWTACRRAGAAGAPCTLQNEGPALVTCGFHMRFSQLQSVCATVKVCWGRLRRVRW